MSATQLNIGSIPGANSQTNLIVGSTQTMAGGLSGEGLVAELHGKYYAANRYGNNVFILRTATAGTTVPAQATNLVSTFTLLNPLGSGVILELIRYSYATLNATTVVSDISLYYQLSVGGTNAALGTTTALTIRPALLSSGSSGSQCSGFSAATFTNTMGTNMFVGPMLVAFGATTTTDSKPINYDFDGTILVPPGCAITTAGNAAQSQAGAQCLIWAEWKQ